MAEQGNSPDTGVLHCGTSPVTLREDKKKHAYHSLCHQAAMLDLIPPSYESATDRDAWVIIAQYIPSSDLCAASLVSHRWHKLVIPFLWGDPASHFGTEDDAVYGTFPAYALRNK